MSEQLDLLDLLDLLGEFGHPSIRNDPNPMVRLFGCGPDGRRCGSCRHLKRMSQSTAWMKCGLRKNTNGKATDHRARWSACAKY